MGTLGQSILLFTSPVVYFLSVAFSSIAAPGCVSKVKKMIRLDFVIVAVTSTSDTIHFNLLHEFPASVAQC